MMGITSRVRKERVDKTRLPCKLVSVFWLGLWVSAASAQALSPDALVSALHEGGYIIFMRHANAPGERPTLNTAAPGNDNLERQLDDKGQRDAEGFGTAILRLAIPISSAERSDTFRTRQTAELAGFGDAIVRDFLLEESMVGVTPQRLRVLLQELAKQPESGNRLLISHSGNIMASFPGLDPAIRQGEALIIDPSRADDVLVARIPITAWPGL